MDGEAIRRLYALSDDDDDGGDSSCCEVVHDSDGSFRTPARTAKKAADFRQVTPVDDAGADLDDVVYISSESDTDLEHVDDIIIISDDDFVDDRVADVARPAAATPAAAARTPSRRPSTSSRYFNSVDVTLRCFQCNGVGHRKADCEAGPRPVPCYLCGQHGHEAARCPTDRSRQSLLFCWICSRHHHDAVRCSRVHLSAPGVALLHCFVCGAQGHFNCGQPSVRRRDQGQCANCAVHAHLASDCPHPKLQESISAADLNGIAIRTLKCHHCGSTQHKKAECFKNRAGNRKRGRGSETPQIQPRKKAKFSSLPAHKKKKAQKTRRKETSEGSSSKTKASKKKKRTS